MQVQEGLEIDRSGLATICDAYVLLALIYTYVRTRSKQFDGNGVEVAGSGTRIYRSI